MTFTDRLAMIQAHLEALWPPAWRAAFTTRVTQPFFVTSHPDPTRAKPNEKPPWVSSWYRVPSQLDTALQRTLERSATFDEYYSVNLGRPDCTGSQRTRLKKQDILMVPGLLGDFDGAWGAHKGDGHRLPESLQTLVTFLQTLPTPPTLMVDTGGGVHTYHLFPEPWLLETPEDRAAFEILATRFQHTVERLAQERHQWTSNGIFTTDLVRVLRLPGTINHKYGTVVTTLENTGTRYSAEAISAWLDTTPSRPQRTTTTRALSAETGRLDIVTLATHYGMALARKADEELCGAHPVHGSDTGTNVAINPEKQAWCCFRHGSGGSVLEFLAVCAGLLPCEHAKPGGLRGMAYVQAVTLANEQWHANIILDERQARLEAQETADNALADALASPEPTTPPSAPPALDPDDPEQHRGIRAHQLPAHLRDNPDPRVRRHWRQVYRNINELKQRYSRDPYALVVPSHPEGVSHAH